jgi:hypothetical protein
VVCRKVAPDVIRSLYGGKEPANKPVPVAVPKHEPIPAHLVEREAGPVVAEPAATGATGAAGGTVAATGVPGGNVSATLGDVAMRAGRQTIGESLRGTEKDLASIVASAAARTDLKKSIGLNDRFLMIRDLFDGDGEAFDRAIARLDEFTDLDDAIIHIHDTYDWSADSEGTARLIELLERKLG